MYRVVQEPPPGSAFAAALVGALDDEEVSVWPECWAAFELFVGLRTQWRTGLSGPTGLDYLVLHRELDDMGLSGEERLQMKDDIRTLERAALAAMREADA